MLPTPLLAHARQHADAFLQSRGIIAPEEIGTDAILRPNSSAANLRRQINLALLPLMALAYHIVSQCPHHAVLAEVEETFAQYLDLAQRHVRR